MTEKTGGQSGELSRNYWNSTNYPKTLGMRTRQSLRANIPELDLAHICVASHRKSLNSYENLQFQFLLIMLDQVTLAPISNDSRHLALGSRFPSRLFTGVLTTHTAQALPMYSPLACFKQLCTCLAQKCPCICCALYEALVQTEDQHLKG